MVFHGDEHGATIFLSQMRNGEYQQGKTYCVCHPALRVSTKDIKLAQAAAGHTTSAMTLRYYVKGRETISKAAAVVDRAYSGQ